MSSGEAFRNAAPPRRFAVFATLMAFARDRCTSRPSFSALPVRSCAFCRIRLTRRPVDTGPGLTATARTPSRTLTLPRDWVKAVSAALPVTPHRIMRLRRVADHVDDDPGPARFHQRVGDELRALRRLQRESEASPFVLASCPRSSSTR
jgi:hypothetical protein